MKKLVADLEKWREGVNIRSGISPSPTQATMSTESFKKELQLLFAETDGSKKALDRINQERQYITTTNRVVLDELLGQVETIGLASANEKRVFHENVEALISHLRLKK